MNEKSAPLIVLYNRIPKTGSTTFTNAIAYDIGKVNNFWTVHLNMTKNRFMMNRIDQGIFINNITKWNERLPAFYHGHFAFMDFTKFGHQNPVYVNMIREPLERLLSHYYFLRYGDDYRVGLKRKRAGNNETFDDCVIKGNRDCDFSNLWVQIPYFCGSYSFCAKPGNKYALEMAKRNYLAHYLVVGTTEKMDKLIRILDKLLPAFFNGAYANYQSLPSNKKHLRNTLRKSKPSDETMAIVKANIIYQMEREFYDFVDSEFDFLWKKVIENSEFKLNQFHYEKIK
uniref:Sulfotransfer_1 domain-containing protein n=1 Tax=Rhabditophanes sp. KR3021 TaxID=114890 RepID=A0AC35TN37_9BILA